MQARKPLIVLEAMKMEIPVHSPFQGPSKPFTSRPAIASPVARSSSSSRARRPRPAARAAAARGRLGNASREAGCDRRAGEAPENGARVAEVRLDRHVVDEQEEKDEIKTGEHDQPQGAGTGVRRALLHELADTAGFGSEEQQSGEEGRCVERERRSRSSRRRTRRSPTRRPAECRSRTRAGSRDEHPVRDPLDVLTERSKTGRVA